ncbi:uncharacterized protein LOC126393433 [Epinephelus moara]|uniref:uncharacterized protein LOC126393433 n=1 Tax=Epinephelus moara TaxID=300413 RepID=UPI00214EFF6C|nr:uncharacterized protein LOC126393433 [Epinephelus moara]
MNDNSATIADERGKMNEEPCSTSEPTRDAQTQWSDPGMEDHTYSKVPPIMSAPSIKPSHPVADSVLESFADSLLYTGIQLIEFHTLVSCLQPFAPASSSMPVVDQILMTLMKLRQNFDMADLARRFKTPQHQVKKTVGMWIDIMSEHIKDLIPWLPRETIKDTLPQAFKEHFPNTICVIGRTETVTQKATKQHSVTELQRHYYGNNTVKYLVAISPSGIIMFISDAYDAKCSDRYIMQTSGILNYLRAGDEVIMGDWGFTARDLLEECRVNFIMPAFTNKKCQLTKEEVTRTQCIAHANRHVERAIRRLKVYKILSQPVPIKLVPKITKMLKICAGLVNLRGEFK